jgi:hypothetical protein
MSSWAYMRQTSKCMTRFREQEGRFWDNFHNIFSFLFSLFSFFLYLFTFLAEIEFERHWNASVNFHIKRRCRLLSSPQPCMPLLSHPYPSLPELHLSVSRSLHRWCRYIDLHRTHPSCMKLHREETVTRNIGTVRFILTSVVGTNSDPLDEIHLWIIISLKSVVGTNSDPLDEIHLWIIISYSFCLPRLPQVPLVARPVK